MLYISIPKLFVGGIQIMDIFTYIYILWLIDMLLSKYSVHLNRYRIFQNQLTESLPGFYRNHVIYRSCLTCQN